MVVTHPEGEPRARNANLRVMAPVHHSIVGVGLRLHGFYESFAGACVLVSVRRGVQDRCASPIVISIPG